MKKKVLLVDDETDFLDIMGQKIRSWGYEVVFASNGKEAIDGVKSEKPDIIVLDYMMPEMDGVSALKEIRKIDSKIPAIIFTAYPDEKIIKEAEKLGVTAFIPKLSTYSAPQENLKAMLDMAFKEKG